MIDTNWTPERHAAAKARREAAVGGPIFATLHGSDSGCRDFMTIDNIELHECHSIGFTHGIAPDDKDAANAAFVIGAYTDFSDALAEIERIQKLANTPMIADIRANYSNIQPCDVGAPACRDCTIIALLGIIDAIAAGYTWNTHDDN